jgi:micrococcal nuclease
LGQRTLRGKFSHGQTTISPPYHYRATVTSVYDGDTCTVDLDLGLSITLHKQKIRLNRINAPELRGRSQRRGRAARDFLRSVIQEKEVLLQTIKDRKGKYDATTARSG